MSDTTPHKTAPRKTPIAAHQLREACYLAPADPRTVIKLLRGGMVAPLTAERIRRALEKMGLAHLIPAGAGR